MTAKIFRHVLQPQLQHLVSTCLKPLAAGMDGVRPYVVVIFKSRPVRVGHVRKALRDIDEVIRAGDELPVLVGVDFTQEALEIAERSGVKVLEEQHHGWTEERYSEIHTSNASPKKFPPNA